MSEPHARLTVEEYLAQERRSETRNEYLAGEVFAMTGASREHNLIAGNIFAALHGQLRGRSCEVYANDMRVRVQETGLYTYPDLVVACGEPRFEDGELDTLLNPTLVVEVLSRSTQDYDRGTKFAHYRTIPELREYLLFTQERVHAEHFVRRDDGSWVLTETSDRTAAIELASIGCRLALADVYERVSPISG